MILFKRISMVMMLIGFSCGLLQADFIGLSVWERTLPSGEKQHIICCGDWHNLTTHADQQADELVKFIAERKCDSDCILVEDMTDFEHVFQYVEQYLKKHMDGYTEPVLGNVQKKYHEELKKFLKSLGQGALLKIGLHAESQGVRVINSEYRQLLLGLPLPASWEPLVCKVSSFMWSSILEELKAYDDNDVLNHFYKDIITRSEHFIKSDRFSQEIEFLDAKFLHNIYQLQIEQEQSNMIALCAGALHTINIERILPKLGYISIYREGFTSNPSITDVLKELFVRSGTIHVKNALDYAFPNAKRLVKIEKRVKNAFHDDLNVDIWYDQTSHVEQQGSMLRARL